MADVKLTQIEDLAQSLSSSKDLLDFLDEKILDVHMEMNRCSMVIDNLRGSWKEVYLAEKVIRKKFEEYVRVDLHKSFIG